MHQKGDKEALEWIGNLVIFLTVLFVLSKGFQYFKEKMPTSKPKIQTYLELSNFSVILQFTLFVFIVLCFIYIYYYKNNVRHIQYYRVVPHVNSKSDKDAVNRLSKVFSYFERDFLQTILSGPIWFRFLIYMNEQNEIEFYIASPDDVSSGVKSALLDAYPKVEMFAIDKDALPLPSLKSKKQGYGGCFGYYSRKTMGLPFQTFIKSEIGNILVYMRSNSWIDLQFSPSSYRKLQNQMSHVFKRFQDQKQEVSEANGSYLQNIDPDEYNSRKSIYRRYVRKENIFLCSLNIWSENDQSSKSVIRSLKSKINTVISDQNRLQFENKIFNRIQYKAPLPWHRGRILFTASELANFFHLPDGSHSIYTEPENSEEMERGQVVPIYEGQEMISDDEFRDGLSIGTLMHPVKEGRVVKIPFKNFTEMSLGTGKTGQGKTTFILNTIFNHLDEEWYDNSNAPGLTFFDGKGEDYVKLIAKILKDETEGRNVDWDRIHVFNLSSKKYVLGLNLLHRYKEEDMEIVVENALQVLKNAYSGKDSVFLDRFGSLALLSLLETGEEHSILGLGQMIRKDDLFRKRIAIQLKSELRQDWDEAKKELEQGQVAIPILNRLQKIRYNQRLKRMFGQAQMDLHVQDWMDQGHLVFFNLAGLTTTERKMIIGYIITQYHQQCHLRKNKDRIHFNWVDEFHLVQIPIVKKILSLDRSTGHAFAAMTQYATQLVPDIADAFYGNVGTIIACKQGFQSAKILRKMSSESMDAMSIQKLRKFTAAVNTLNKNGDSITMYVRTKPTPLFKSDGKPVYFGDDIIRKKREEKEATDWVGEKVEELMKRDCQKVEEVDRWIENYINMDTVLKEVKKNEEVKDDLDAKEDGDVEDDGFIFT